MRIHWFLLNLILSLELATRAGAAPYMPLATGQRWIYASTTTANRDTVVVEGPTLFQGTNAIELSYHGFNEGLLNYWTVDPNGVVRFHGWARPDFSWAARYVPPLRMVEPPLVLGHSWGDTAIAHCIGLMCDQVFMNEYTVSSVGPLTVPAGTFQAAGVTIKPLQGPAIAAAGFSVLGTWAPAPDHTPDAGGNVRWWSEGVGTVHETLGWTLERFDDPTPARVTSWGRIKRLYR